MEPNIITLTPYPLGIFLFIFMLNKVWNICNFMSSLMKVVYFKDLRQPLYLVGAMVSHEIPWIFRVCLCATTPHHVKFNFLSLMFLNLYYMNFILVWILYQLVAQLTVKHILKTTCFSMTYFSKRCSNWNCNLVFQYLRYFQVW